MHEIDGETHDSRTFEGLCLEQGTIELVRLKEAVAQLRQGKYSRQAGAEFDGVKLLDISCQKLTDIVSESVERVFVIMGPIRHNTIVVVQRSNELHHTVDEVAEVLEQ